MSTTTLHQAGHGFVTGLPPRLDADSNGMSMTPEEFDAVEDYDACFRYELIRGVVVANPWPEDSWAALWDEMSGLLWEYWRRART